MHETVRGTDVVVSVFGQVKGSPATLQTDGTQNIVDAMAAAGIRRIITLSGGGLPAPQHDQPKAPDKIIKWLLTQIARADLATFILTQLDDTTFVHELPFVSR